MTPRAGPSIQPQQQQVIDPSPDFPAVYASSPISSVTGS